MRHHYITRASSPCPPPSHSPAARERPPCTRRSTPSTAPCGPRYPFNNDDKSKTGEPYCLGQTDEDPLCHRVSRTSSSSSTSQPPTTSARARLMPKGHACYHTLPLISLSSASVPQPHLPSTCALPSLRRARMRLGKPRPSPLDASISAVKPTWSLTVGSAPLCRA